MSNKIVLGLSGGVDSAVTARLLQQKGFEVFGLFLDIGNKKARDDALDTAEFLGVDLEVLDISVELEKRVCAPFVSAYLNGETPNPCILCNPAVKFKALCDHADNISAKFISTGHYARVRDARLLKGMSDNDQSYMLCRLRREQVARLILPLGDYKKTEVRELARDLDIPIANKPDSMEICFIPSLDYARYIEERGVVPPPGNFVDREGRVLGEHRGIHHYTIGQRRGLNFSAGKRVYVSEIRPEKNEVVLSDDDILHVSNILVRDVNWLVPKTDSFLAEVRTRHSKMLTPAVVTPHETGAEIFFKTAVRAPTKGQSAVFYDDETVVGGGFIT